MKKIISLLVAAIIALSSFSIIANAADTTIVVPKDATVDYLQKVKINCLAYNLKNGNYLAIYADEVLVGHTNGTTLIYTSDRLKTTTIFTVKIVDKDGKTVKNSNGSEIKDYIKVTVKNSFFEKLKGFFNLLFGRQSIVNLDILLPTDIETSTPETIAEILDLYNAARKATAEKGAPKGHRTMNLDGDITGEGAIGAVLKVLSPAAKSALERNSRDTDWIPGADCDDIRVEDVKSAKATVNEDGSVTVEIQLKDQTDGPDGGRGPVERGIGTLGSIEMALNELGAEITEGRDTITLTYSDAYIKATIKDGFITSGTWHYLVKVKIVDAKAKLGITANLKNLDATIEYSHVI